MGTAEELNGELVATLEAAGLLTDPRWREAMLAVPRHLFVPDTAWARPDRSNQPGRRIDRLADPGAWLDLVYADAVIVTQVDDGAGDPSLGQGEATSSISAPGIVVLFLELLDVGPEHTVLEVGAGSGWTAGLLAHVAEHVVSLEIDEQLADWARRNVEALKARPEIRLADAAEAGLEAGAYDRLHVACGVADIPWSWVEALKIGGVGVLPWCPPFGFGNQLRFTRTSREEAVGRLHGACGYMMLRSQRGERGRISDFLHHWDDRTVAPAELDPDALIDDSAGEGPGHGADIAITARVPGVAYRVYGRHGRPGLLFHETGPAARPHGSWALIEDGEIHGYGPRDLYAEVMEAWRYWLDLGGPARDRFGMTITPDGHRIWLDDPRNPVG